MTKFRFFILIGAMGLLALLIAGTWALATTYEPGEYPAGHFNCTGQSWGVRCHIAITTPWYAPSVQDNWIDSVNYCQYPELVGCYANPVSEENNRYTCYLRLRKGMCPLGESTP